MWMNLAMIAVGGASGTLCRYGVSVWMHRQVDVGFPWGTLMVNLLGCFLFGLIAEGIVERVHLRQTAQLLLLTGFMGAFTTFSTFGHDTLSMMRQGQWGLMGVNIMVHNVLGLLMVGLGVWMAHLFVGRGA